MPSPVYASIKRCHILPHPKFAEDASHHDVSGGGSVSRLIPPFFDVATNHPLRLKNASFTQNALFAPHFVEERQMDESHHTKPSKSL